MANVSWVLFVHIQAFDTFESFFYDKINSFGNKTCFFSVFQMFDVFKSGKSSAQSRLKQVENS